MDKAESPRSTILIAHENAVILSIINTLARALVYQKYSGIKVNERLELIRLATRMQKSCVEHVKAL